MKGIIELSKIVSEIEDAIITNKTVIIANKEILVAAGEMLISLLSKSDAKLLPVDSEHNALLQVLLSSGLEYKINNISCIKIDTEGYEFKIIKNFFKKNNLKFFPKYLIVEHNNEKNYIRYEQIILKNNYEIIFTTNSNTIYQKNV